jgi:putative hydrolase of the HAD superfamily
MRRIIMKYEVIMFDADDTLFDFEKSEIYALQNSMEEYHITFNEDNVKTYKEINKAVWKELENGLITQKELNVERFRRFSEKLNIKTNAAEFAQSYVKHLADASFLYEESMDIAKSLYKNYRLTILSNGLKEVQNKRIRHSIIAEYFEDIVISEEVGISKPNPKIYELALNNVNYTDKSKVLMVGDSLASDIRGGINFGIDTCWLNRGHIVNTSGLQPTYEIYSLPELKKILE